MSAVDHLAATERTTTFERNPELDELLGDLTSVLGSLEGPATQRWPAPRRPVLFVTGPPRCGSTHLLQRLASTGAFGFPSNLVARFHRAPYIGAVAHRLLFDAALDHRGEMGLPSAVTGASDLGKTRGPANVSEFWHAWRHFLPACDTDEYDDALLAEIDWSGLTSMVAALEAGFDKPVAMKSQLLAYHHDALAEHFPGALMVRIRRRPAEVVDSILRARERHSGGIDRWWSLRPRDTSALAELAPIDQVARQVVGIEAALDRAAEALGPRMIEVDFHELCCEPAAVDDRIRRRLEPLGIDMAPVRGITTAPPTALPAARAAELTTALSRVTAPASAEPTPMEPGPVSGPVGPEESGPEEHLLLYSREAFGRGNLRDGDRWIRVDHRDGNRLVGTLSATLTGSTLWSGYSAPFAGPDFVRALEAPAHVGGLIDAAISRARAEGARTLRLTLRPPSYSDNEGAVLHAAAQRGFRIVSSELSCSIDIAGCAEPDDHLRLMGRPARKAVRRTADHPWSYTEVDDWGEAYDVLARNRSAKNRSLRLSLSYLEGIRESHPGDLRMFELRHDAELVAAALLYRLRPDVESVQYWGDDAPTLDSSPMPRLAHEVARTAIGEGIRLLDLGKSSVNGQPDEGLVQFKRGVGAVPEPILTVELSL